MREFSEKTAFSDLQESVEVLKNEVKNYYFEDYSALDVKTSTVQKVADNRKNTSLLNIVIGVGIGAGVAFVIGGNKIFYPVIGGSVGLLYDFWKSKKQESSSRETEEDLFVKQQKIYDYKQTLIREIRSFDDKLRAKWEISMKLLINEFCDSIDRLDWDDDKKYEVKNSILVYDSLIIDDYVYTETISDIESNSLEDFQQKINTCISKWRSEVVITLEEASKEQWNKRFLNIFNN